MARYIKPKFLGVLNFFDQRLKCEDESVCSASAKADILASLADVIKLMGSEYVGSVKHKILSTLNTALGVQTHVLHGTWEAFITTIDKTALNPILGQVVA